MLRLFFYTTFAIASLILPGIASAAEYQEDCTQAPTKAFISPSEEIAYYNRYHNCYAERLALSATPSKDSFLGKGLELFSHPEFVEAIGFSKYMCTSDLLNSGNNYPCWFETSSIGKGTSIEEAAKTEAPKILLTKSTRKSNTDLVEYVLCLNDDPTKPKEYTRSCTRGYKIEISEYARGDVNHDGTEDVIVRIKHGINHDPFRRCYIAAYTRKNAELLKMIFYSPTGQCN